MSGAAALTVLFGAGPASADNEYQGRTYGQVREATNNRAVIASRTGSYLPTEECIVTGNRRASFLDSSGNANAKILVDLNCNDVSALNGHPGNSVVTESAKKVQEAKTWAVKMSKDYEQALAAGKTPTCLKDAGTSRWCVRLCDLSGDCSGELSDALGL